MPQPNHGRKRMPRYLKVLIFLGIVGIIGFIGYHYRDSIKSIGPKVTKNIHTPQETASVKEELHNVAKNLRELNERLKTNESQVSIPAPKEAADSIDNSPQTNAFTPYQKLMLEVNAAVIEMGTTVNNKEVDSVTNLLISQSTLCLKNPSGMTVAVDDQKKVLKIYLSTREDNISWMKGWIGTYRSNDSSIALSQTENMSAVVKGLTAYFNGSLAYQDLRKQRSRDSLEELKHFVTAYDLIVTITNSIGEKDKLASLYKKVSAHKPTKQELENYSKEYLQCLGVAKPTKTDVRCVWSYLLYGAIAQALENKDTEPQEVVSAEKKFIAKYIIPKKVASDS